MGWSKDLGPPNGGGISPLFLCEVVDDLIEEGKGSVMGRFMIRCIGEGLGDCFFIEIKGEKNEDECIIMVDGHSENQGEKAFGYIKEAIMRYVKLDYIVITHIDDDHIGGILRLLELPENDVISKKLSETVFIYNNVVNSVIHYPQAERLETALLTRRTVSTCRSDYSNFSDNFLVILSYSSRKNFDPAEYELYRNRPVLTFIHPDNIKDVEKVHEDYKKKKRKGILKHTASGLVNRYSIVFLLEYMNRRALFTGDSYIEDIFPKVIELKNIVTEDLEADNGKGRKVDIIKIPHHGAVENNKNLAAFANRCNCRRFIVTGERQWKEKHPAKALLDELYKTFYGNLVVYTPIDMSQYEYRDEVIRNTESIDVMEEQQNVEK